MTDLLRMAQEMKPVAFQSRAPLPVYRLNDTDRPIFYTPGLVATVSCRWVEPFHRLLLQQPVPDAPPELEDACNRILQKARSSRRIYKSLRTGRFNPECLTLYPHNKCNLQCTYCLREKTASRMSLKVQTVQAAARLVARNCKMRGRPFTTVFHGWGEPSHDFALLQSLVRIVDQEAQKAECAQFRYIATNGVTAPEVANYLASHFDYIGLSCDGPPDIQNRQRPMSGSRTSSEFVERTVDILKKNDTRYSVRTTITRAVMDRQEEIADYLVRRFQPAEIYFEPAYRRNDEFRATDAEEFFRHFRNAVALASALGVPLRFSGVRMFEIHGPYCNVFRGVLNLTPENTATACFASEPGSDRYSIGKAGSKTFYIYHRKIRKLQEEWSQRPQSCRRCFNHLHCAGTCPEECVSDRHSGSGDYRNNFRCRLHLLYAINQILAHAEKSRASGDAKRPIYLSEITPPDFHFLPNHEGGMNHENR